MITNVCTKEGMVNDCCQGVMGWLTPAFTGADMQRGYCVQRTCAIAEFGD